MANGDAGRLNCPIVSRDAANKRMPPAIRISSAETRQDAAKLVITKAIRRETAVAAMVPFIARTRTAFGAWPSVIAKKAGTVLIGPNVSIETVNMNAGVIIGLSLSSTRVIGESSRIARRGFGIASGPSAVERRCDDKHLGVVSNTCARP
jgi:hypothetical protein